MLNNPQADLLDENMDKVIKACFINDRGPDKSRVFVIYEDGSRENIFTFNPKKHYLNNTLFIGMTKLEAVFYCDRHCSIQCNEYF